MVYMTKVRLEKDSVFGVFDCPDGSSVMPKRSRSNTPLQALNLFNSNFVMQQASLLEMRSCHLGRHCCQTFSQAIQQHVGIV